MTSEKILEDLLARISALHTQIETDPEMGTERICGELDEIIESLSDTINNRPLHSVRSTQESKPVTRRAPYILVLEHNSWISVNEQAIACLIPVTLTCKAGEGAWECQISQRATDVILCKAKGPSRDRAIHNAVIMIRQSLKDPDHPRHWLYSSCFTLK